MKQALIVSAYFPPSNLAGAMRARLMARELHAFGWEPIILAVDPRHYEEANDEASLALLPERLRIETAGALPARFCRLLGFGDVALRGQWALRRRVAALIRREAVDLIFCTVMPGYTSLVGAWAKRRFGLPFVLDYQDPWVSDWGAKQPLFSKAGLSQWLALRLEPKVVSLTDALTAVSDETLASLRKRHLIAPGTPIEIIPIGADAEDHRVAMGVGKSLIQRTEVSGQSSVVSSREQNVFHLAYVGTVIEGMLPSVRTLFHAVRAFRAENPARQLRIHFIGTSAQPAGRDNLGLERLAGELGVGDLFRLEPRRVGYLDALRTMQDADALLLLGSLDSHYTASKLFPCWLSGKPVLGLFHEASTVNPLARELGGVLLVTYGDKDGPETRVKEVASALQRIVTEGGSALPPRHESAFEPYSGRGIARTYANLFDRVVAK